MNYYPINLDIKNKNCLVVGGGDVGTRKVKTLLKCGAKVIVVSIEFSTYLKKLSEKNKNIILHTKKYDNADMKDIFLVIGATNNNELNSQIAFDAKKNKILCNIADCPSKCEFILPAFIESGDLVITISTSGASPAFAKKIRKSFEKEFGEEYGLFLKLMRKIREKLLKEKHFPEEHKPLFEAFIKENIEKLIKQGDIDTIDKILKQVFGIDRDLVYNDLMEN